MALISVLFGHLLFSLHFFFLYLPRSTTSIIPTHPWDLWISVPRARHLHNIQKMPPLCPLVLQAPPQWHAPNPSPLTHLNGSWSLSIHTTVSHLLNLAGICLFSLAWELSPPADTPQLSSNCLGIFSIMSWIHLSIHVTFIQCCQVFTPLSS